MQQASLAVTLLIFAAELPVELVVESVTVALEGICGET